MSTRCFRLNTHLTFPLELHAVVSGKHHCAAPGHVVEIDAERCRVFDRFLRGRIRMGDLVCGACGQKSCMADCTPSPAPSAPSSAPAAPPPAPPVKE